MRTVMAMGHQRQHTFVTSRASIEKRQPCREYADAFVPYPKAVKHGVLSAFLN